jgi:tripartite-type tricarboxylate transporter receptor subunit TctC
MRQVLCAISLVASCLAVTPAAFADAELFRDKPITIFVGYGAGGGYDQYARLLSRHMSAQIPGKPVIVVRNMPGGGSLVALNHVYNVAPRDGASIVTFGPEVAFEPLRGAPGLRFDTLQINWLGSMNRQVSIAVFTAQSNMKSILDARGRKIIVGASGTGSQSYLNPIVYNAFLGTNFSVVTGYTGTKEITLAMERGELQGIAGWSWDSLKLERPAWAASPEVVVAMQVSDRRHPEIPHVPNIYDYVSRDEDKLTLELIFAHQLLGRPFAMAPGVPADRLAALTAAFDSTMKDEAFGSEARKLNLEIDYVNAEDVRKHVQRIFSMPKPLIERAAKMIKQTH